MNSLAVIGVGSAHGDDQLGWYAIDQLKKVELTGVVLEKISSPANSLINLLQKYDFLILIDACDVDQRPGTIIECKVEELAAQSTGALSSHGLGVAEAFLLANKLGTQLGITLPEVELFMVQLAQTETMQPMSDNVIAAVPELIEKVLNSIQLRQQENTKCIN